jgi:signal transduction histidine kinase
MASLFQLVKREIQLHLTDQGLESSVTPTLFRVRLLASGIAISHILFGFLMSQVAPQPFENLYMRAGLASLALLLVWQTYSPWLSQRIPKLTIGRSFIWSIWLHLDGFSLWMYAMNGGNDIWLAYTCTSIMMSFFLMKWRSALNGLSVALILAPLLAMAAGAPPHWISIQHAMTLGLAIILSLAYALAMGSAREQHLRQSLAITGLVQTRLRPSIVAMQNLVRQLQPLAQVAAPAASGARLQALGNVFKQNLARMEHNLQMQRTNAQILGLRASSRRLSAQVLIEKTLATYPFATPKQQRAVQLNIGQDFDFQGHPDLWQHAISNLLKNAIDALHHTKLHIEPGDLTIDIRRRKNLGRISIRDHGLPIPVQTLPHLFEPFYSNGPAAGLGLGLPFCQQLAHMAGGHIEAQSDALDGTVFHIYLPVDSEHEAKSTKPSPATMEGQA